MQIIKYPRYSLLNYFLVFLFRYDASLISFDSINAMEEIFSYLTTHIQLTCRAIQKKVTSYCFIYFLIKKYS